MAAPIRLEYFTDPYCAWSWAFEPILEAVLAKEDGAISVVYRALPLVSDLAASGKAGEDIARAWERIARITGTTIDASAWRTLPPQSTLPALRASKAAAGLGEGAEHRFVQALRPLLMTEARTADDPVTLRLAAERAGLDVGAFSAALEREHDSAIEEDTRLALAYGVQSSPAVVMRNGSGDKIVIQGPRDFELFRRAIAVLRVEEDLEAVEQERLSATPLMPEVGEATRTAPGAP